MTISLQCLVTGEKYPVDEIRYLSNQGHLLDVQHDLDSIRPLVSRGLFNDRLGVPPGPKDVPTTSSGVWRYRELILPAQAGDIVSRREGNTPLYEHPRLSNYVGLDQVYLKHEGENPTGSFKDRGMTVGVTQARLMGAKAVACASTGNTSASMAAYAALASLPALVFIPAGKTALGKLAQALAYGAKTLQIQGDFDDAMRLVKEVCNNLEIYLLNSLNPFRLEGQKSILFEIIQGFAWSPPDWIVLPAGNLGNTAAFGKALHEASQLGLITKLPRLACIQAEGANPFYYSYLDGFSEQVKMKPETIATAIRIGNPVSYPRAVRTLQWTNGLVEEVSDQEIMDAKAIVDNVGIGCEPASAATVAGIQKLVKKGIIQSDEAVVGILTGHILKDPDITIDYHTGQWPQAQFSNQPIQVEAEFQAVQSTIEQFL